MDLICSYQSCRCQGGVPVATVAINNATNTGLLAVRMLGVGDADLQARMSQYLEDTKNDVRGKAEKLEKDGWERYSNPEVLEKFRVHFSRFSRVSWLSPWN